MSTQGKLVNFKARANEMNNENNPIENRKFPLIGSFVTIIAVKEPTNEIIFPFKHRQSGNFSRNFFYFV